MPPPSVPVWKTPANNSTHDASVLLSWEPSTVSAEPPPPADSAAPVLDGAPILQANGTSVVFNFSESGSPPLLPSSGATGFSVNVNGENRSLNSVTRTGNTQFTAVLSSVAYGTDALTSSYAGGNVTDSSGNALQAFSNVSVTNNSTQSPVSAPVTGTNFNDGGAVAGAPIPESIWDFIFEGTTSPSFVYTDMGGADGFVGEQTSGGGTTGQGRGLVAVGAAIVNGEIWAVLDTGVGAFNEPWSGPGVYARASGGSSSTTRSWVGAWLYRSSTNARRLRVGHAVNGTIAYSELSINWPSNTKLNIRFRFQGTTLEAKCWPVGTPEPASWQRTYETTITGAGKAGTRGAEGRTASDTGAVYARYYEFWVHNGSGSITIP